MINIEFNPKPIAPTQSSSRHQQLQRAAQQFETVMLSELMKPLQNGSGIDGSEDGSGNALQSYGTEAMAGALARSGALGFSDRMIQSIEAHESGRKQTTENR